MARFFGPVFWRRKDFPEDKKGPAEAEPAPVGVLDEDRESESLTPEESVDEEIVERPYYFNEWPETFPKVPAFVAERMQREQDRKRNTPVAFNLLAQEEGSLDLIFEGLRQHYIECLLAGRLDVWARAAHASVELLADPAKVQVCKRAA